VVVRQFVRQRAKQRCERLDAGYLPHGFRGHASPASLLVFSVDNTSGRCARCGSLTDDRIARYKDACNALRPVLVERR
jgi:hypothetical protein